MKLETEVVRLSWPAETNIVIGQSHFIKTVEDLAEIMVGSVPGIRYGLAFNEASGARLIRCEGNDPNLVAAAVDCARAVGAGHTFYVVIGAGAFPVNVLDRIKACPEVCRIFCATANPLQVVVARTDQGAGILGVIDGEPPRGEEQPSDRAERKALLRKFGYKL